LDAKETFVQTCRVQSQTFIQKKLDANEDFCSNILGVEHLTFVQTFWVQSKSFVEKCWIKNKTFVPTF